MDREGFDQRTDHIVVVDPIRRRLLWVPRDIWSDECGNRINAAYKLGGPEGLLRALAGLGIPVEYSVCVPRSAVERALADATVVVPVREPMHLWYPLTPTSRVQEGRKPVDFLPPSELLQGERIHQWLGARYARDAETGSSDLDRIRRQQRFLRALLRQQFDFTAVLRDPDRPVISDPAALDDLRRVRTWWRFACADQVEDRMVEGRRVLDLRSPEPRPPRWRRRVASLRRRGPRRPG
jgi:anionic cell wall polymer biosynthesis LytR-Cps2A-Psr (LCP) family protein